MNTHPFRVIVFCLIVNWVWQMIQMNIKNAMAKGATPNVMPTCVIHIFTRKIPLNVYTQRFHSYNVRFCLIEKQSRCCFTFDLMLFLWTVTSHTKNPQKVNSINSNMDIRPRLHEKKDVRLCVRKRKRESEVGVRDGYERVRVATRKLSFVNVYWSTISRLVRVGPFIYI